VSHAPAHTVAIVAAVDLRFGTRRVLTIRRERGLDFQAQINLFTDLAMTFHVDVGFIEQNGFQGWLVDELRKRPGGGVFFGHTTGRGRLSFAEDGIPILKLALHRGRWIMPSADPASRAMARIWQAELGAFGCRNGRVEGVGEHDDIVIASWHLELAVTQIERHRDPGPEFGYLEDIDPSFERVRIGKDF